MQDVKMEDEVEINDSVLYVYVCVFVCVFFFLYFQFNLISTHGG